MRWFRILLLCGITSVAFTQTQENAEKSADWQVLAGGRMEFEVASIRQDNGEFKLPSFPLSPDEGFHESNGRFHADFALPTYITFAYKIAIAGEERKAMLANLPEWARSERFDIEATAPLHATKDQYRLMMQALLADRFGLKLHFEMKDLPVLAMTLSRPGTTGPRLISHELGQTCQQDPKPETFPQECYLYHRVPAKDGMVLSGARATSMKLIGNFLETLASASGEVARPVVDQTGLTGLWDFTLLQSAPTTDTMSSSPAVIETFQEQLGIKLKPSRAVIPLVVIDRIEQPTDN